MLIDLRWPRIAALQNSGRCLVLVQKPKAVDLHPSPYLSTGLLELHDLDDGTLTMLFLSCGWEGMTG